MQPLTKCNPSLSPQAFDPNPDRVARVAFPVDAAAGGAAERFTAVGASAGAGAGAFSVAASLVDAAPWGAAEVAAAKGGVAEGDAGAEAVAASLRDAGPRRRTSFVVY